MPLEVIRPAETSWLLETLGSTDDDACYMSGSILDGFGNPRSDIDIFFVTRSVEALLTRSVAPFARFRGPDRAIAVLQPDALRPRFDIECHTWSSIERLAARLARTGDPLTSLDDAYGITYDELDFLHRMKIGRSLNGGAALERLRALFDLSRLPELLASRRLSNYERQAEDAIGALEGGQMETAFSCGRGALEAAFDAFLAASGETYVSPKWKFEKARRLLGASDPLFVDFWTLVSVGPLALDGTGEWLGRALRLAQRLAVRSQSMSA